MIGELIDDDQWNVAVFTPPALDARIVGDRDDAAERNCVEQFKVAERDHKRTKPVVLKLLQQGGAEPPRVADHEMGADQNCHHPAAFAVVFPAGDFEDLLPQRGTYGNGAGKCAGDGGFGTAGKLRNLFDRYALFRHGSPLSCFGSRHMRRFRFRRKSHAKRGRAPAVSQTYAAPVSRNVTEGGARDGIRTRMVF